MILFLLVCLSLANYHNRPAMDPKMVEHINTLNTTWRAHMNPHFIKATLGHAKTLCGTFLTGGLKLPILDIPSSNDIPDSFDPRDKPEWVSCASLKEIRDQGPCGSCWAISSAEVMTDRICIASQGSNQPHLSVQDIASCCSSCAMFGGCNGGFTSAAFTYWKSHGVVTGGPYQSGEGCYPYEMMSCDHHVNGTKPPCPPNEKTPTCKKSCLNGLNWDDDKHYAASTYGIYGVDKIQTDLMTNGPVTAGITVYEDFMLYKSGVYQHTTGAQLGGHAIKILGWGVENDVPYWLCANSWNTDWGLDGTFKILRGHDECGIEGGIYAGLPRL